MTKTEAIQAMYQGNKVTHRYFCADEYITINNDKIVTEEGYEFNQAQFWRFREHESWETDDC